MAQTIKIKNSQTATNTPGSLVPGEIAINEQDEKLFYRDGAGAVQEFDLTTTGGGGGKLLQQVSGVNTGGNVTSTSTTWLDVFSVNITPQETTSKIEVDCEFLATKITGNVEWSGRIIRDGSTVITTNNWVMIDVTTDTRSQLSQMLAVDTPGVTSSVQYKFQIRRNAGTGSVICTGTSNAPRTMRLREIGV